MNNVKKKKFRINIFDVVIVVIVLALAVGLYAFTHRGKVAQQTKKITYLVELRNLPEGFTNLISEGDKLTDNVKNYYMGKVLKVETVPYVTFSNDIPNVQVKEVAVEGRENAIITVEADVIESDMDFKLSSGFTVKGGLEANVKGRGYAGSGYILEIER